VTCFLWLFLAGAAVAQTPAASRTVDKPPPGLDKAAPSVDKAPAVVDQPPPAAQPPETLQSAMEKQRAAIAVQREAVRKQRESAIPWMLGSPLAPPGSDAATADCDPIADPELTPLIDGAAQQHQLAARLLRGVIEQESGFRACAISPKGAKGLMQLMPATIEQFRVGDVFDAKQNIDAGATYLRQLMDRYKDDVSLALAAYNAGPAAVDKAGGIPDIKETQDYVEGILKKMK
jgi:soluble lytic murein transglycosylase-like protein